MGSRVSSIVSRWRPGAPRRLSVAAHLWGPVKHSTPPFKMQVSFLYFDRRDVLDRTRKSAAMLTVFLRVQELDTNCVLCIARRGRRLDRIALAWRHLASQPCNYMLLGVPN